MMSIVSTISGSKQALILISLIVVITIVDSQFINIFYGTDLGTPSNFHLLLFISFAIATSVINIVLLRLVKRNDIQTRTTRTLFFRVTYIITSTVQYAILLILVVAISEMVISHGYHKILSLLVVYFSHFCAAGILAVLSITLIQWFRITRSLAILTYGVVFVVIIFPLLLTIPLLTEQYMNHQPNLILPLDYLTLINRAPIPSSDIAFIYGLGNYALPLMIVSSWILTVSIFKSYIN